MCDDETREVPDEDVEQVSSGIIKSRWFAE